MCGINGIFSKFNFDKKKLIEKMNHNISHRGPDNIGVYLNKNIALGHSRLSIVDLNTNGNQPMHSNDGRYVLVFNGEIYNFNELKKELNYSFTTKTDSEVVLAAYIEWGEKCLDRFNGMFAFTIWDNVQSNLFIARDRLGIKPLYYFKNEKYFAFSSEIRALMSSELFERKLSKSSLIEYLKYQTVHSPNTIIEDVFMLEAGSFINVDQDHVFKKTVYWKPGQTKFNFDNMDYQDLKKEIKKNLTNSVVKRMFSDVDSGAFLSGGIDSSALVGLMSESSSNKVKTFNISFDESEYSEAKYANIVAEKFSTEHTEIKLSPEIFLKYIPLALDDMDHPSGDGPNSWVVSKYTKEQGVKMVFSGLGGDELFAGYSSFKRLYKVDKYKWIFNSPDFIKKNLSFLLKGINNSVKKDKIQQILKMENYCFNQFYMLSRQALLDSQIDEILNQDVIGSNLVNPIIIDTESLKNSNTVLSKISSAEIQTYMQNVLLRDTDQMSMAHSLEVRVPFLDHELVDYVLSVEDQYKYPKFQKKLLIDSLDGLLPKSIYDRPKMGFSFPWNNWLKNELFEFANELINSISKRKTFNEKGVLDLWLRFNKGDNAITFSRIWPLIVLEYWMQKNNIND